MTPLAVGPVLALIGIVAAFFILRGRAKTKKSMYRTLREQREQELRKARDRATAAKGAAERAASEREAAAQTAAAAAAAPPVEPTSTAGIQVPAAEEEASPSVPPAPAYTPQQPAYTPPEPLPTPPPAPIEQAPVEPPAAEVLPEPPPTASDQTKPAWEIVEPDKPEADNVPAGAGGRPGKASWELDTGEQTRVGERHKSRGAQDEVEQEDLGKESTPQVLLSYAGLVVALLVILLGILFMIGVRTNN